jgi:hypothetical protein
MIEKDFVPYEPSVDMKELGFDEPCFGVFSFEKFNFGVFSSLSSTENTILVPTFSQAFRWFREKHGLYANLSSWTHEEEIGIYHEFEIYGSPHSSSVTSTSDTFETYEDMELACLKKLIKITNEQQKTTK